MQGGTSTPTTVTHTAQDGTAHNYVVFQSNTNAAQLLVDQLIYNANHVTAV